MMAGWPRGRPVVAYRAGVVPELVVGGVTRLVCDTFADMPVAVERVGDLDRWAWRAAVAELFSAAAMASGYERVYAAVCAEAV